ncbi:MAG: hypothetical protein PUD34_05555 [bacterium]|nr:hypothetical protein [bacterium]
MNIFYSEETLFISLDEEVNEYNMARLQERVFKILRDYNIEKVNLRISRLKKDNALINDFIREYNKNFDGILKIN